MNPKVSIVIPTFNGSDTIGPTIGSVLQQTYTDYEIVFVDDGSTDATLEIVRAHLPRANVIRQHNQGTMASRQTGIDAARGELIALLDQDDVWSADHLETEIEALSEDPAAALVLANMSAVDDRGSLLGFNLVPDSKCYTPSWEELLLLHPIAASTALFSKDVVRRIGGLDSSFAFSGALGDSDTFARIAEVAPIRFLNRCLGQYRWSETRPGRLLSFLDNLQVYARKHWQHSRLSSAKNGDLRTQFVTTCCNYAVQIYRLLLNQHADLAPQELVAKLNAHNQEMADLFGDTYTTHIGLRPLSRKVLDSAGDTVRTLLFIFLLRLDLQNAHSEVMKGDLHRLIEWGASVGSGRIQDPDYPVLRKYAARSAFAAHPGGESPASSMAEAMHDDLANGWAASRQLETALQAKESDRQALDAALAAKEFERLALEVAMNAKEAERRALEAALTAKEAERQTLEASLNAKEAERRGLEAAARAGKSGIRALEAARAAGEAERQRLWTSLNARLAELQLLEQDLEGRRLKQVELEQRVSVLEGEAAALRDESGRWWAKAVELAADIHTIHTSNSWRLTAPIRALRFGEITKKLAGAVTVKRQPEAIPVETPPVESSEEMPPVEIPGEMAPATAPAPLTPAPSAPVQPAAEIPALAKDVQHFADLLEHELWRRQRGGPEIHA